MLLVVLCLLLLPLGLFVSGEWYKGRDFQESFVIHVRVTDIKGARNGWREER